MIQKKYIEEFFLLEKQWNRWQTDDRRKEFEGALEEKDGRRKKMGERLSIER
jgi:hypothetical protein